MSEEEKKIRHCPNCGEIVDNKFCPTCGQENREFKATFIEMIREYFSHVLNLDSRLYMTIKFLLLKPGLLTIEYFKGRRESYISPLRLYLIISMLYFLTFAVQDFYSDMMTGIDLAVIEISELDNDSLHVASIDSLQTQLADDAIVTENGEIEIFGENIKFDDKELLSTFRANVPKVMFFLLPLGALLLKLLYRRKFLYFEHIVFLLHVHSFFFLTQIFERVLDFEIVSTVFGVLTTAYLYLAMKKFYQQKAVKTILKMFFFSSIYFILLAILLLGNLLVTIFSII